MSVGVALDNLAVGVAIGIVFGMALSQAGNKPDDDQGGGPGDQPDQADKEPAKSGESDELASTELPSPETSKGSDKSSSETPSSPSESS